LKKNKIPNTISDKEMADIRRKATKVEPPMFSKEAIRRREMYSEQLKNADKN